jgi:hypothetical protein
VWACRSRAARRTIANTALFSESDSGLQSLLDKLLTYCQKWNITVNTDQTKVMVFKRSGRKLQHRWYYGNCEIMQVNTFTYLGVNLSYNGNLFHAQKHLSEQASKALFSLFDHVPLTIADKLKLFDCMILPILNYGCKIWGFHCASDVEKVHLRFYFFKVSSWC